jgi:hypothetical protein
VPLQVKDAAGVRVPPPVKPCATCGAPAILGIQLGGLVPDPTRPRTFLCTSHLRAIVGPRRLALELRRCLERYAGRPLPCDLCQRDDARVYYTAGRFTIDALDMTTGGLVAGFRGFEMVGGVLACGPCASLAAADKWGRLTERAARHIAEMIGGDHPPDRVRQLAAALVMGFRANRLAEPPIPLG